VLRTPRGVLMWDCTAYISPACIAEIRALCTPATPFLGIAISHPHFYNASTSIFRALVDDSGDGCVAPDARIFVSARDREWWMRTDEDGLRDVLFVEEDVRRLGEGLTLLRCGGRSFFSSESECELTSLRAQDTSPARLCSTGTAQLVPTPRTRVRRAACSSSRTR
jgi:hypothetical protein